MLNSCRTLAVMSRASTAMKRHLVVLKRVLFGLLVAGTLFLAKPVIDKYLEHRTVAKVNFTEFPLLQPPGITLCSLMANRTEVESACPQIITDTATTTSLSSCLRQQMQKQPLRNFSKIFLSSEPINCNLEVVSYFATNNTYQHVEKKCDEVSSTMEIFSVNHGQCYTFFSMLNGRRHEKFDNRRYLGNAVARNIGTLLAKITVNFSILLEAGVKLVQADPFLLVHSATDLPLFVPQEMINLTAGVTHTIFFKKSKIYLLPKPFETNCVPYNLNATDEPQSRSDCVESCNKGFFFKKCSCIPPNYVIRLERDNDSLAVCPQEKLPSCHSAVNKSYCFSICGKGCIRTIFEVVNVQTKLSSNKDIAEILIIQERTPELIVTHQAMWTRFDVLCLIGGICGLMVGFSFYGCFEPVFSEKVIGKLFAKKAAIHVRTPTIELGGVRNLACSEECVTRI